MQIFEVDQGSDEWRKLRTGKVTASVVEYVVAPPLRSGGESAGRRNLRAKIIAETMTGQPTECIFVSAAMKNGVENEPLARAAYEIALGLTVNQIGFALHASVERFGCSPDGLVGVDGLIEIKCPLPATHISYMLAGIPAPEYVAQMQAQMSVTDREWCDFVSFCPSMPFRHQLFVRRLMRDDGYILGMESEIKIFLAEVDKTIESLDKIEVFTQ